MSTTVCYVAWSPQSGEATYTRVFADESERDKFAESVEPISNTIRKWENEISR